jgi:hypothetical protein
LFLLSKQISHEIGKKSCIILALFETDIFLLIRRINY